MQTIAELHNYTNSDLYCPLLSEQRGNGTAKRDPSGKSLDGQEGDGRRVTWTEHRWGRLQITQGPCLDIPLHPPLYQWVPTGTISPHATGPPGAGTSWRAEPS